MYNIKLKKDDVPVVIQGWKIPKGVVYNADLEEPFVCTCPSLWAYDAYIWWYTEGKWKYNAAPMKIRKALRDFIVTNHLDCSCEIEGHPPVYEGNEDVFFNIKLNTSDVPIVIHGWEISKGAVYNADPEDPFVCLFPFPENYESHIWRYMKNQSVGLWQNCLPPKREKEALRDFIVSNHIECSSVIDSVLPNIRIKKGGPPIKIHGWEIPEGAVYNADPARPFVCLFPSLKSYASYIWRYSQSGSKKRMET